MYSIGAWWGYMIQDGCSIHGCKRFAMSLQGDILSIAILGSVVSWEQPTHQRLLYSQRKTRWVFEQCFRSSLVLATNPHPDGAFVVLVVEKGISWCIFDFRVCTRLASQNEKLEVGSDYIVYYTFTGSSAFPCLAAEYPGCIRVVVVGIITWAIHVVVLYSQSTY